MNIKTTSDPDVRVQQCQYLVGRFDHYMDGVNSKVAFYLGINTFILSGICVGYNTYKGYPHNGLYYLLLVTSLLLLACCMVSIYFTMKAVAPYLKDNDSNDDVNSLIYFGGIAKYNCNEFEDRYKNQDAESLLTDFTRQAHSMAKGLEKKFRFLNHAAWFLKAEYVLLVIAILLIFLILN